MLMNIWNDIKNFFVSNGWHIFGFVVAFILGLIIVRLALRLINKLLSTTKMEKIAQKFIFSFIKVGLYLIWVLVLLSIIGVEITGIITALSALLLAVGLALESNIANLANGIIIVSSHLFKKGDLIEINGITGTIQEINFLFCTLLTPDNKRVTLPNTTMVSSAVTNYGANKIRRVDFTFSVAYESDVELVKKIVIDVMKSNGKVLLDKEPFCRLKTLNSSSLDFFANCWCDSEDWAEVLYYVTENVFNEFKRHNVSVPYNQLEIRNRTDVVTMPVVGDGLPARVEKERVNTEKHSFLDKTEDWLFHHDKKSKAKKTKSDVVDEKPVMTKEEKLNLKAQKKEAKAQAKKEKSKKK